MVIHLAGFVMGEWVATLIGRLGYVGIALLMFAETVFPPLPSEVIMPLAGMQAGRGSMSVAGVILAGSVGALAGNVLWFAAARRLGADRFRGFVKRHGHWLTLSWNDVERARNALMVHGPWFVCLGRLIPTIRSFVSIPAGLLAMGWWSFLLCSLIGTAAWTAALTFAGVILGERFGAVEQVVSAIATAVVVFLAVAYVWRAIRWRRRQR